jgi:putative oxidoreductase
MENLLAWLPALGRIFVGFYFAIFGFWNIYHWRPFLNTMIKRNIPLPFMLLPLGIFWQISTGTMIMFGSYVKLAAVSLILFTLIGVYIFHDFWNHQGELRRLNMTLFIGNLTISIGGLLLLLTNTTPLTSISDLFT